MGDGIYPRFRLCGKVAFFREKISLNGPTSMQSLQDGSCIAISVHDRVLIFSQAQYVITFLTCGEFEHQYTDIVHYNVFANIETLSTGPHIDRSDSLDQDYGGL